MAFKKAMLKKITSAVALLVLLASTSGCGSAPLVRSPKELISSAWNNYRSGAYSAAIEEFNAAVIQTPETSEDHLQALYGLATTWNWRSPGDDRAKAESLYQKLQQLSPGHDLAAWSLLALARLKHVAPVDQNFDAPEARRAYQECIDRFPNHPAADEAFIYQQSTLIVSMKPEEVKQASATLEKFVVQKPNSRFNSPAYHLLSKAYELLKQPDKQLQARVKAIELEERDPENPEPEFANAYWNIATIAEFDAGDFDTARKYYQRLIDEYPTDIHKFGAKLALRRMDELEAKLLKEASK
jgi:tetratricopeptide (TPR) repeat protein